MKESDIFRRKIWGIWEEEWFSGDTSRLNRRAIQKRWVIYEEEPQLRENLDNEGDSSHLEEVPGNVGEECGSKKIWAMKEKDVV